MATLNKKKMSKNPKPTAQKRGRKTPLDSEGDQSYIPPPPKRAKRDASGTDDGTMTNAPQPKPRGKAAVKAADKAAGKADKIAADLPEELKETPGGDGPPTMHGSNFKFSNNGTVIGELTLSDSEIILNGGLLGATKPP